MRWIFCCRRSSWSIIGWTCLIRRFSEPFCQQESRGFLYWLSVFTLDRIGLDAIDKKSIIQVILLAYSQCCCCLWCFCLISVIFVILQVKKAFFALVHNSKFFFCILYLVWTFHISTIGNKSHVWVLPLVFDDLESVMLNCVGVWFQVEFWKVFNICTAEINWQYLPPPAYFNPIYEAGLFLYSPGDIGRAQWYEID